MNSVLLILSAFLGILIVVKALGGAIPDIMTPSNVKRIAEAIATAEGFYVAGSRPARNHNPGDMTSDLIGSSVGMDGPFVVYSTDDDGWNNLYKQITLWLDGGSAHATPDSTVEDISQFYTTTDQTAWATTVANKLGVSLDTPIGEVS